MRVFVADANSDFRLAAQMLINQQRGTSVTGIAIRTDGLVAQVLSTRPDILLVNWDLPGSDLVAKLACLRKEMPALRFVIICVRPESKSAAQEAGFEMVVDMGTSPEELVKILSAAGSIDTQ